MPQCYYMSQHIPARNRAAPSNPARAHNLSGTSGNMQLVVRKDWSGKGLVPSVRHSGLIVSHAAPATTLLARISSLPRPDPPDRLNSRDSDRQHGKQVVCRDSVFGAENDNGATFE